MGDMKRLLCILAIITAVCATLLATTVAKTEKTCAVCGAKNEYSVIMTTNIMESSDLDSRPGEMMRSTISFAVQKCPACGYCATDVGKPLVNARETVADPAYKAQLANPAFSELANKFLAKMMIEEKAGERIAAIRSAINAGWASDDAKMPSAAATARKMSIRRILELKTANERFSQENGEDELMVADMYRRNGEFSQAEQFVRKGLELKTAEMVNAALVFERKLIEKKDVAVYKIEEAEASIFSITAREISGSAGLRPASKSEKTIKIPVTALYPDGRTAVQATLKFTPNNAEIAPFFFDYSSSFEDGRYHVIIPKGLAGKLVAGINVNNASFRNCPDKAVSLLGSTTFRSGEVLISGKEGVSEDIRLFFPVTPYCEEEIKQDLKLLKLELDSPDAGNQSGQRDVEESSYNDPSLYEWSKNVNKEHDPSLTDNAIEYFMDSSGNITVTSHETSSRSWNIQLIVRYTAKENSMYKLSFDVQSKAGEAKTGFEENIDVFFGRDPSEQSSVRTNIDSKESPQTFSHTLPVKVNIGDELMVHFNIAKSLGTFYIKNLSISPYGKPTDGAYSEIHTPDQLNDIRMNLAGSYRLAADISLSSYGEWEPIGSAGTPFTGKIDGNGFKITGLKIDRKAADFMGFFGNVSGGAIINLALENINIAGRNAVGGIAGQIDNGTVITNSYTTGIVSAANAFSGGIAGQMRGGRIINSYSKANIVSSAGPSGGITGITTNGEILNSFSAGNVIARNPSGGIAGILDRSTIANSYSTGNVSTSAEPSGGIAGQIQGGIITNCYSTGAINMPVVIGLQSPPGGFSHPGGIAGRVDVNSTIKNNAAINSVINALNGADRIVGGFMNSASISNNFALETMTAGGATKFSNDADKKSHGVSRSAARLKEQVTYSGDIRGDGDGGLGWKFGGDDGAPWKMPEDGGYPILYWQ